VRAVHLHRSQFSLSILAREVLLAGIALLASNTHLSDNSVLRHHATKGCGDSTLQHLALDVVGDICNGIQGAPYVFRTDVRLRCQNLPECGLDFGNSHLRGWLGKFEHGANGIITDYRYQVIRTIDALQRWHGDDANLRFHMAKLARQGETSRVDIGLGIRV
jgi:hypothetical protein